MALFEGLDKQIEDLKLLDSGRTRWHKSESLPAPEPFAVDSGIRSSQSWQKDFAGNLILAHVSCLLVQYIA